MKIQLISDLHIDHGNTIEGIFESNCDCLVIPGDVFPGPKVYNELVQIKKYHVSDPSIIFVPGNHEYYGYSKEYMDNALSEMNYIDGIHILNRSVVEIDGITFIGSTGWWDSSNGPITKQCIYSMNDFRLIKDIKENGYGVNWGIGDRQFFENELSHSTNTTVCVSHMGPTKKSHPKFQNSLLNTLFQNDWKYMIEKYQPTLWLYGHTHEYMDYHVGNTRCVCNPYGYPNEYNKYFSKFVIEI